MYKRREGCKTARIGDRGEEQERRANEKRRNAIKRQSADTLHVPISGDARDCHARGFPFSSLSLCLSLHYINDNVSSTLATPSVVGPLQIALSELATRDYLETVADGGQLRDSQIGRSIKNRLSLNR